jgi:hypothetical protein
MDSKVKNIYKIVMSSQNIPKIILQKILENNIEEGFFSPIPGIGFKAYKLQKDKWDWMFGCRVLYLEDNKWYYIRTKGGFIKR